MRTTTQQLNTIRRFGSFKCVFQHLLPQWRARPRMGGAQTGVLPTLSQSGAKIYARRAARGGGGRCEYGVCGDRFGPPQREREAQRLYARGTRGAGRVF